MSDELTEFPTKLNALPADSREEARDTRRARKEFAQKFSPFVKAMREAMSEYLHFRTKGVTREDAIKGLESVLRDTWPKSVSKFPVACDDCGDTGYAERICRQYMRCERHVCQRRGEEWQHRYVVICSCAKGETFTRAAMRTPDEATIGKVSKPKKSWQRLGV